jgi:hypothetical protein
MSLIGMDLNATRARAVSGPRPQSVTVLRLDDDAFDLPLALSLEARQVRIGRPGTALSRCRPHLACLDFLPWLGAGRTWQAGRHSLDADAALGLVFNHLRASFGSASGVVLAIPSYLVEAQVLHLRKVAERARWALTGSVPVPVAVALAACSDAGPPWSGLALVADLDGYALTWSAVEVADGQARLLQAHPVPQLARGVWLRRLLDGVAHRCVRLSRRDPRESAEAEQSLYDQLALYLDSGLTRNLVEFSIQAGPWFQHLMFHPDELSALLDGLVRQTVAEMEAFVAVLPAGGPAPVRVLLTPAVGILPGLASALEQRLSGQRTPREVMPDPQPLPSDFGEDLVEEVSGPMRVSVLGVDDVALAAHHLAARFHRGEMPAQHLDTVDLPDSPAGPAVDAGPARLHFRGRDHLLGGPTFTLGRDPSCDLVFESELYPTVSARHCDILFDRRAYSLCDRSRHGTLLNDRPIAGHGQQTALHSGDWIRLGPSGPVLRFLGRSIEHRKLVPNG